MTIDINHDLLARLKSATDIMARTFGEPPFYVSPGTRDIWPTCWEAWEQIRRNRELFDKIDSARRS